MVRFTIICKTYNRNTESYDIDQVIELSDYYEAMNLREKLEDQYYSESMELYTIDFEVNR